MASIRYTENGYVKCVEGFVVDSIGPLSKPGHFVFDDSGKEAIGRLRTWFYDKKWVQIYSGDILHVKKITSPVVSPR